MSLSNFKKFAEINRKKEKVDEKELWPIDKLYKLLENEDGGFLLIFDIHSTLGIEVKQLDAIKFEIKYRDPFNPELKSFIINTENGESIPKRQFKIQWFGKFNFFHKNEINRSLLNLAKYQYILDLPPSQETIIQTDTYHCGDICAYLATKSKVKFGINEK